MFKYIALSTAAVAYAHKMALECLETSEAAGSRADDPIDPQTFGHV